MSKFDKSMFKYLVDETSRLPRSNKALDFYGASIRLGDFISKVDEFAGYLQSLDIKKGDNVILCLGNIPNAIIGFYAINKIGAIANLAHPLIPGEGLKKMSEEMDSKAFILFDEFFYKYDFLKDSDKPVILCSASDFLPRLFKLPYKAYIRGKVKDIKYGGNVVRFRDTLGKYSASDVDVSGDDIAIYMHSGGTTGVSKTVMHTNLSFNNLADNVISLIGGGVDDKDGMLMVLPIFHTFGLGICMHTVLCGGGQAILMPKFSPKGACRLIRRARVTYISGVPNMYAKMLSCGKFKGRMLKKIKNCYCGGEKISSELKRNFESTMAKHGNPIRLCAGYGLTEAGICCVNTMDIHKDNDTLGKPLKNNTFAIIDSQNNFLRPFERGMITLSCNTMMAGYYNHPQLDGEVFFYDGEGRKWLKTGDIGYMDDEGYVYFVDREKRMVKISGVNVYPQEIEDCVKLFDGVKMSCAIPFEEDGKNYLKLYVVLDKGATFDEVFKKNLKEYISSRLLKYNVPKIIEMVDTLPLTQIGKVDFKKLQESFEQ